VTSTTLNNGSTPTYDGCRSRAELPVIGASAARVAQTLTMSPSPRPTSESERQGNLSLSGNHLSVRPLERTREPSGGSIHAQASPLI
jgi:hypothetical protein